MEDPKRRQHFFSHGGPGLEEEKEDCHWCQIRSFPNYDTYPITVINEVNDDVLPADFRFIHEVVLGAGVTPAEASFRSGCECRKDESCRYNGCQCLGDVVLDESDESDEGRKRKLQASAYQATGARVGMLRGRWLEDECDAVIYECHEGCACSAACPNRVVERGRRVPLQIFRTKDRGWGVKSTADIVRGQFVDRYIGEIITAAEADRRRKVSDVAQKKDVYLFDLDKFHDPRSLDPRLSARPYVVDGEFMSGPTRFINHSCDPNMRIYARVGDHADKHLHDLALFAIKDVPRGTELTFDYTNGVEDEDGDKGDRRGMTRCYCGSKKCRGWLF
ncbi:probable Histone-lysine N-methyltransferase, H3 lysine-9 specific dim-5 [Cephalotrichum gorgonifer]|uniref:Probable Histone-lysine N-methyltransferase, H3 lysine-9 specific dim-5 n=1 Tax=Cephalotrichum gorgonifer TaxID=2041049 RepID=A0AAE8N293_9PEZI|nr:probable Histone-lysine N-methyltransferase, H3 lysine-9 specific dim-5 [Cephalotrichum gorgonifer]